MIFYCFLNASAGGGASAGGVANDVASSQEEIAPLEYFSQLLQRIQNNDSTLTALRIRPRSLTLDQVKAIAEALKVHHIIKSIDFSENPIGDDVAGALADMLKINTTITSVNFAVSRIGEDGMQSLAEALEHNHTILSM